MPKELKPSGTWYYFFEISSSAFTDIRHYQWPERSVSGSCYNFCIMIVIVQLFLVSNLSQSFTCKKKMV